jgi:hypothetical protein
VRRACNKLIEQLAATDLDGAPSIVPSHDEIPSIVASVTAS